MKRNYSNRLRCLFGPVFRRCVLAIRSTSRVGGARRLASRSNNDGLEGMPISNPVHIAQNDATKLAVASITGTPFEQLKRVAQISRPAKSAMQSGKDLGHGGWTITFESSNQWRNPLMGWAASADPMAAVDLTFKSKEDAIFYCESNAHDYVVLGERTDHFDGKSYASNFLPKEKGKTTVDFD